MEFKWTSVNDKLPDESGWYMVFAPTYSGGSSSGLECINGVMFSQFKIAKNGNKSWSIETGYYKRPNCVLYWAPVPIPTELGHFRGVRARSRHGMFYDVWVDNDGKEYAVQ